MNMKKIMLFGAMCAGLLLASCDSKEEGTINGVFSVSETKQVKFSSGNLQYSKTAGTYQFAEHQWVILGSEKADYKKMDVFDVFAWGSGDNPRPERCEEGAEFVDWGTNPIANGGEGQQWRTLSPEEWEYVVMNRPNAINLIAYGKVENVKGIILLPDAWEQSEEVPFESLADTAKITYNSIDVLNRTAETDLTVLNVYDAATWEKMEEAGAVFLPFTNWSFSKDGEPTGAEYWSSGKSHLSISKTTIWPDRGCVVDAFVQSVRLVKDVVKN